MNINLFKNHFINGNKRNELLIICIDRNDPIMTANQKIHGIKSRTNDDYTRTIKNDTSKSNKRFYSTSPPSSHRKLIVNSTSPQKLIVNSTYDKISFVDNQSVLLFSNILRSQDVEHVKQFKQVELVIKILNCNAYAFYNQNFDKPFFCELKNVLSLLSLLKDGYYTFDFYFYIVSRKKALFEVFSFNYNFNNRFDTGSSFVKNKASFGYLKLTSIKLKICKN